MNLTICALNSKYIHSSLSLWCMYTACKAAKPEGVNITAFEGTVNENEAQLFTHIMATDFDAVAFSCYIWNIKRVLSLCEKIKGEKPSVKIILGGPEVAYRQKDILENYSFVDFVLSGEGEAVLPPLIGKLFRGEPLTDLSGVSHKSENRLFIAEEFNSDSFDFPSPYCEEYFAALKNRIAYFESSRGCPYSCAYCLSGRCGKVRFKSMDKVKKELLSLSKSGTGTIKFVDRTFNCNNIRAVEILRFISQNYGGEIPLGVCFHFEISADILSEEFLSEVSKMPLGAVQFEVGIQSWNEQTLKAIGRKTNLKKLEQNVKKLLSFGNCHIHTDLIAGLPFEDYESFKESFNKSYALMGNMLQLGFLKLLHGSQMSDNRSDFPCLCGENPPYEVQSTPWLTSEALSKLHLIETELDRLYNSGRFTETLSYALSKSGLSPFDFYLYVGEKMKDRLSAHGTHLDNYTNELYKVLCEIERLDKKVLRDKMLLDRIASNNSGVIPESLLVFDSNLKKVKHFLNENYPPKKGVNRTVGILYSENKAVYCDYDEKNPVTARYKVSFAEIFSGEEKI